MKIKYGVILFVILGLNVTAATTTPAVMTRPATMTPASLTPATMTPATMTPATLTPTAVTPAVKPEDIDVTEDPSDALNITGGKVVPALPLEPAIKTGGVLEIEEKNGGSVKFVKNEAWQLTKNITVLVDEKVEIFKPLEIVNNLDVGITVVDDEVVKAPFTITFNDEPEAGKGYNYKIKYVADTDYTANKDTAISNAKSWISFDIDNNGKLDTLIYSDSPFIQHREKTDNYIEVDGARISNMGVHRKQIYMVVDNNL